MLRILIYLIILLEISMIQAQIIINEFMASNVTFHPEMHDFDDYTDWIELHNPNDFNYTLNGFFITDDFENPLKWKIADGTIINANDFLIIWADDYNDYPGKTYKRPYWPWDNFITQNYHTSFKLSKSGEDLGLYKADQGEVTTLIEEGSIWKYLDNGTNQGSNWVEIDYNDDSWDDGYAELGYGDGDEATIIEYGQDGQNKYITTYFRHSFNVNNADNIQNLTLRLKRDDGAVVYLNGNEIVRNNMPAGNIYYDTFANTSASPGNENLFYSWSIASDLLQNDQNILAVEIHQASRSSSDLSFDLELQGTKYSNPQLIDSLTFNNQLTDISYGRALDNQWSYFGEPTPGMVNSTNPSTTLEKSSLVSSSLDPGFYNETQTITLSTENNNDQIYYTLDGSRPGSNAILYSVPITLSNTVILKALSVSEDKLPSEILTSSYFINEPINLASVSLIAEPNTLWDDNIGIYQNEFKQREIPVSIQYFNKEAEHSFDIHAGARIGGLNIWTKPQKPFTIYTRGRFGGDFINHKLFENKQIVNFSRIVLRNGGDDWEETLIRDPMTESLILGQMNCGYMAYSPVALYLNGNYWGIHNIREKFDKNYFHENFNVNTNEIEHLEYTQTASGIELMAIEGNLTNYQSLLDYILTNDIDDVSVYNQIKNRMNIDSFIDHITMTLYCANTSWAHNREWWRSNEQDGKWNWLIVDLDRGFNINNISSNLLDDLIEDYELFGNLLSSQHFSNRFSQRAAAHLNNTFLPDRINNIVDSLSNIISSEMPRHINKWGEVGGISSINAWEDELNGIKQFSEYRNEIVINQFVNELNLDGTVTVLTNVTPPNSGTISVNNVNIVDMERPGLFFKNMEALIIAKPSPGYNFIGWQQGPDTNEINYNFNTDTVFTAIFELSEEIILPNTFSEDVILTNEHPYVVIEDLVIPPNISVTINEGTEIRMLEEKNIIVNGSLNINGSADNKINILSHGSTGDSRWGAICFNNSTDTSFISHLNLSGASKGIDPMVHHGAISGINSNIKLNQIQIEDVLFPIFIQGGSVILERSSIKCDFVCDFINVKGGEAIIKNNIFYGSNAQDTDAIDLDNVSNGIVKNNKIYHFNGYNSDGIDIGEEAENILIESNLIYHAYDKGISVGQSSSTIISKNVIIGSNHGVAIKDNSESYIINNTFFKNDTSVSSFEKNDGAGGGSVIIVNTILSNSLFTSIYNDEISDLSIRYSLSDTDIIDGTGNIFSSPLFVDSDIYNLELNPISPCINAGDPALEYDDDGSISDIGAYYNYDTIDYPFNFESESIYQLKINELLAVNDSNNEDEYGEFDDWIELYNPTSQELNLSGLYLTDDLDNLTKWQFSPSDQYILPNGYMLIWCDNDESQGSLHTNFKLSSDGEILVLVNTDRSTIIDSISFGIQTSDQSFGRVTDGNEQWGFLSPTPGNTNSVLSSSKEGQLPKNFKLSQNYPNPFNPTTLIKYSLPIDTQVKITIHNLLGKEIKTLVNEGQTSGIRTVKWNGTDFNNQKVSAGLYLYSIQTTKYVNTKKMILLK